MNVAYAMSPDLANAMSPDPGNSIIPDEYKMEAIKNKKVKLPAKFYYFTNGEKLKLPYAAGIEFSEESYKLKRTLPPVYEGLRVSVDWKRPAYHFWDTGSTDGKTVIDYIHYHGYKANVSLLGTLGTEYTDVSELKNTKEYIEYYRSFAKYKRGLLEIIKKHNEIGLTKPY